MKGILIVDDSLDSQILMIHYLNEAGFTKITAVQGAAEAMEKLEEAEYDLVLMDIMMPEMDGLEACRLIKMKTKFHDLPIIMVTAKNTLSDLAEAFDSGAFDYITKPLTKIELLARVKSALKLKTEIDQRKVREEELLKVKQELEEVNEKLQQLSFFDPLTGLGNRRYLDQVLREYCRKSQEPLALFMIDIDCFKAYNDTYGHQQGDTCLRQIAQGLSSLFKSPSFVARYGGEEFVALLLATDFAAAQKFGETLCEGIEALAIEHKASPVKSVVTISIGLAFATRSDQANLEKLIEEADQLLYQSKAFGRNRLTVSKNPNINK